MNSKNKLGIFVLMKLSPMCMLDMKGHRRDIVVCLDDNRSLKHKVTCFCGGIQHEISCAIRAFNIGSGNTH